MKKNCNTLSSEHLFDEFHVISKEERLVEVVDKKDAISKTEKYDIVFKKCSICGVIDDSEKIEIITETKYHPKDEDELKRIFNKRYSTWPWVSLTFYPGECFKGTWYDPARYRFNSETGEFERYHPVHLNW